MASRMQSTGFPMAVQVSSAVVEAVDQGAAFHPLGERPVKGLGMVPTFLLKVRHPLPSLPAPEHGRCSATCMLAPAGILSCSGHNASSWGSST